MDFTRAHYDDGTVACDDTGLAIWRYYPWGSRRVPYGAIRDVRVFPLSPWSAMQPWRIWGPGDLTHWWNLDTHRSERRTVVVIDTGERFKPAVTPVDPDGFERVLRAHLNGMSELRDAAARARLLAGAQQRVPAQRELGRVAGDGPGQRDVEAMVPEPTTRVRS